MNEYVIRTRVEYVLCVEADTEEEASREAAETDFNDWEQFPSEEYDVELIGGVGKEELAEAVGQVLGYLWEEEQKHCERADAEEHIFKHLVTLRQWLENESGGKHDD